MPTADYVAAIYPSHVVLVKFKKPKSLIALSSSTQDVTIHSIIIVMLSRRVRGDIRPINFVLEAALVVYSS